MSENKNKLLIASNRLPVIVWNDGKKWQTKSSAGGLVTAMAPILRDRGGTWIGWPGTTADLDFAKILKPAAEETGFNLRAVPFSADEENKFYYGMANEIIWPLFHDLQTLCNFSPDFYQTYLSVNERFAGAIAEESKNHNFIWVHDYHLMHVAHYLKKRKVNKRTGFFLHIPFPPLDIFLKLPWRREILAALLEFDLIGFQTQRDRDNFVNTLKALRPGYRISGRGSVVALSVGEREVQLGHFPISIDYDHFSALADSQEVAEHCDVIRGNLPGRKLFLGVDRLDYTKGIPYRLRALDYALEKYPELRGRITLVQVVVPSRRQIPEYQSLLHEIEMLVGRINGKYTQSGYIPIHYMYRSLQRPELVAYYSLADTAVITPLKDGMNLVAKEFCASHNDERGVLMLSEFAGASLTIKKGPLKVNPYDIEGMADAMYEAFNMPIVEQKKRMRQMRKAVKGYDIFDWVENFLEFGSRKKLKDFPVLEGEEKKVSADRVKK